MTYTRDAILKIIQQIELLPVEKAKEQIREYEQQGFSIDWEETCFTRENGVKVLHPDYFIAIFSIEHKPTTCSTYGHRELVVSAEDSTSITIECGYCGYREKKLMD